MVDLDTPFRFQRWVSVDDLPVPLAVYETVFWEPEDTTSLRMLIRTTPLVKDRRILEIGTGTGLISLCCLQRSARQVVATDVNPAALKCAQDNARRFPFYKQLDLRLVSTENAGAFAVIKPDEKFDLIISNPPWENGVPQSIDQYALYDPGFELLKSLIGEARGHLHPDGKLLLAYGCTEAIDKILELAEEHQYRARILDDRRLEDLQPVFLPGMLVELVPE
jgi:methylase of polypeptide subunit release factors